MEANKINVTRDTATGVSSITKEVKVEMSPQEIATIWWSMDAGSQAEFFNHIASLSDDDCLNSQLAWVDKSDVLTPAGRYVMDKIGSFA
jgi:hypothetical protein